MINLSKVTGEYLSWELDCIGTLIDEVAIGNILTQTYDNGLIITTETNDSELKEIYKINNITLLSGNKLLLIVDTNQPIIPEYVPEGETGTYDRVWFDTVWMFSYLDITDSIGQTCRGEYECLPDGNINIVIPQSFIDSAVGQIDIDPTVTVIASGVLSYTGIEKCASTSALTVITGYLGATGYYLTSPNPTTTAFTNEFGSTPFVASTDSLYSSTIALANGTFLTVYWVSNVLKSFIRNTDGSFTSPVTIDGSVALSSSIGYRVRAFGDGNKVMVYWNHGSTSDFDVYVSEDGGATWADKSMPTAIYDNYKGGQGWNLVEDGTDTDKMYLVGATYVSTTVSSMKLFQYILSTDTWSFVETIGSIRAERTFPLIINRDKNDGSLHINATNSGGTTQGEYWTNKTGSWVNNNQPGGISLQNFIGILDSNGVYGMVSRLDAGNVYYWNGSSWDSATLIGTAGSTYIGSSQNVLTDTGQPLWLIETDGVDTNYVYDADKVLSGGTSGGGTVVGVGVLQSNILAKLDQGALLIPNTFIS